MSYTSVCSADASRYSFHMLPYEQAVPPSAAAVKYLSANTCHLLSVCLVSLLQNIIDSDCNSLPPRPAEQAAPNLDYNNPTATNNDYVSVSAAASWPVGILGP